MKKFLQSRIFRVIASFGLAAIFFLLCPPCFSRTSLFIVLAIVLLVINLNTFFGRFRILTHITRFAVGGLFVFSGFIKANDPVGFSIKLEEYFDIFSQGFSCEMQKPGIHVDGIPCLKEINTQNDAQAAPPAPPKKNAFWDFFAKHSLFLAIFICAFEMAVGFCLLLGIQVRWTLLLLLAMIVFFAFLTFYSACCNKVQSCGCFGDAIKLTPWESFWKDLILLVLICVLFVGEKNIGLLFKNRIATSGLAGIFLFASFAFPVYTWRHLPLIDFRPYKIGTNLWDASQNKRPPDCVADSDYNIYYYQNVRTGKILHFHNLDSFPTDSTWQFFCRDTKKIRKGNCGATVLDFYLQDYQNGEDYTDSLLKRKGIQFFLIMHDLNATNTDHSAEINALYDGCAKNNIPFNALCGSNYTSDPTDPNMTVEKFVKITGAKYPFLSVDGTALKTAIRSNPGLMMLKDGVVTAIWSCYDIPSFDDVMHKYGNK